MYIIIIIYIIWYIIIMWPGDNACHTEKKSVG